MKMSFGANQNMHSPKFEKAVGFVLRNEGGYNETKGDKGGATNFGISLSFLKSILLQDADLNKDGVVDKEDVKLITRDIATKLYYHYFWVPSNVNLIIDDSLCTKVFDMCVNMGAYQAIRMLQFALSELGQNQIQADGKLGQKTALAVNSLDADLVINEFISQCQKRYRSIVRSDPTQAKFLIGWLNRLDKQV